MHFHFPLLTVRQGKGVVRFSPHWHLTGFASMMVLQLVVAPQWSQIQRWRHEGIRGSWLQLRLGQIFLGYKAFQVIPYPGLTPGSNLGWCKHRFGLDLHVLGQLQCTGLCLRSGRRKLGLQKLGNQSKNMCFSKSLFSSCFFCLTS